MPSNCLSLNPSKTAFLIFGLPQQLCKLNNPTNHLYLSYLACLFCSQSWCYIRYKICHLYNISSSAVSKSCFCNIRDLRLIRNTIDQTTAFTIATSLIHSKIDYRCRPTSFLRNLPATLQLCCSCCHQNS